MRMVSAKELIGRTKKEEKVSVETSSFPLDSIKVPVGICTHQEWFISERKRNLDVWRRSEWGIVQSKAIDVFQIRAFKLKKSIDSYWITFPRGFSGTILSTKVLEFLPSDMSQKISSRPIDGKKDMWIRWAYLCVAHGVYKV